MPKSEKARQKYAQTVGEDGYFLLQALERERPKLQTLSRVQTLKQVWERHYARCEVGESIWRKDAELSRTGHRYKSPYDTQARHSNKHELSWTGFKVHLTETCDADLPRLITHVHTTVATTQDVSCTKDIQQGLADKALLPSRHIVDAGYVEAQLLVQSQQKHQVELFGPPRGAKGWQVKEDTVLSSWGRERLFRFPQPLRIELFTTLEHAIRQHQQLPHRRSYRHLARLALRYQTLEQRPHQRIVA